MLISHRDTETSYLFTALVQQGTRIKQGAWVFTELYSKNIPLEKCEKHFSVESVLRYEKDLDDSQITP